MASLTIPAPGRSMGRSWRARPAGESGARSRGPSSPTVRRAPGSVSAGPLRLTRRGRRLVRTVVLGLTLVVVLTLVSVGLGAVSSATEGSSGPTTTRVVVQPGQTLWSLAGAALPDLDPRAAVSAVAQLNGLSPSARLVPGQPLLLPLDG